MGPRQPRREHGWIGLRFDTPTLELPQSFGMVIAYSPLEHLHPWGWLYRGTEADALGENVTGESGP